MQVREIFPPDILLLQLFPKGHLCPCPPLPAAGPGSSNHLVVGFTVLAQPPLILRQYWQKDFSSAGQGPRGQGPHLSPCLPTAAAIPPGVLLLLYLHPQVLQVWLLTPYWSETRSRPKLTLLATLLRRQLPACTQGPLCRQQNKEDLFWRQLASEQMRLFSSDFMNSLQSSYVTQVH